MKYTSRDNLKSGVHLGGLGTGTLQIFPDGTRAVKSILELNARASKFGAVNSVFSNGRIDHSNYHAENIWVGESYALCSLAIYEGFIKEGLSLARKIWLHFAERALNSWS